RAPQQLPGMLAADVAGINTGKDLVPGKAQPDQRERQLITQEPAPVRHQHIFAAEAAYGIPPADAELVLCNKRRLVPLGLPGTAVANRLLSNCKRCRYTGRRPPYTRSRSTFIKMLFRRPARVGRARTASIGQTQIKRRLANVLAMIEPCFPSGHTPLLDRDFRVIDKIA